MILFWERKSSSFDQQKPKAFCRFQIATQGAKLYEQADK